MARRSRLTSVWPVPRRSALPRTPFEELTRTQTVQTTAGLPAWCRVREEAPRVKWTRPPELAVPAEAVAAAPAALALALALAVVLALAAWVVG